jgi:hypothetical protein
MVNSTIPNFANGAYTGIALRKSSATGVVWNLGSTVGSTNFVTHFHITGGNSRFNHRDDAANQVAAGAFNVVAADAAWHITTCRRNGTDFYQRAGNTTGNQTATLGTTTLNTFTLGARNSAGSFVTFFNGDIAELIIQNAAYSDVVIDEMYANIDAAWGI